MSEQGFDNAAAGREDRPVGELVRELSDQTSRLVRQELELARLELTEKGKRAGKGAGMFGAAGLLGLFILAALTTAAIAGLGEVLPVWASALIVAGLYAFVAAALAMGGKKEIEKATPAAPAQTVASVKQDVRYTTERAKEARR